MRETNYKIIARIWMRDDGGITHGGSSEGGEMELDSEDILNLDQGIVGVGRPQRQTLGKANGKSQKGTPAVNSLGAGGMSGLVL